MQIWQLLRANSHAASLPVYAPRSVSAPDAAAAAAAAAATE